MADEVTITLTRPEAMALFGDLRENMVCGICRLKLRALLRLQLENNPAVATRPPSFDLSQS